MNEHVLTPDDRCPCGEPQEGSGYCSYECFSKFEMGSIVEPAPEMPRPPAVEAPTHFAPYGHAATVCGETIPKRMPWNFAAADWDSPAITTRRAMATCARCLAVFQSAPETTDAPAVDALGAVEPSNADTGRGTGVREAHARPEAVEDLNSKHWLKWNTIARTITGCRCGFAADESSDCGFGDSVVLHLLEVGAETARPVHYLELADSLDHVHPEAARLIRSHVKDLEDGDA